MLSGLIALFFLAAILFAGSPSLLAMAQQTGATTTTTTDQSATTGGSTSPLTFTLKMEDQGAGEAGGGTITATTPGMTPPFLTTPPPSGTTTPAPSSSPLQDDGVSSSTTSAATGNNLSTRNIGIEVNLVRGGNEAPPIILPINVTIPANINNLELCATSAMAVGAAAADEICQPVLRTIDLTENAATTTSNTTTSGIPSSSSTPTMEAPTASFPPVTTGADGLISIEETAVITVLAPITAQIQNAQVCAQLFTSGTTQSCNQIILNPQQTAYTPVNVDMTTFPTPTVISSSFGTDTTTATGTTTSGTTDTTAAGGGATTSSSTTTIIPTPTTPTTPPPPTTTTTPPTSTNNNNNTTDTTGGGATSSPPPPLGDILMGLPQGATTSSDGTIGAVITANPPTFEGYCPPTIEFFGAIGDELGNRDVRYRFVASNGDTTPEQVIHFDQPGIRPARIETLIEPPVSWVAIEILQPVQFQSNRAEIQITCTPTTTTSGGDGTITATLSANPATYEGPCPVDIDFTGTITDNVGNRDVKYRTIDSRGSTGQEEVIHFDVAGSSKTIFPLSASIGGTGRSTQGWVAIEFLEPYRFVTGRAAFEVICTNPLGPPTTPPEGTSSGGVGGITISDLDIVFLTASGPVASDTNTYNGPCPVGASITGTITDNVGNRDVTYRLIMNDGVLPEGVRHFDQPGSERVSFGIQTLGGFNNVQSYQGWFAIEILQPVQFQSNRAEFQITCLPSMGAAPPATLQAENTTTATDDEDIPAITDEGEAGDGGGDDGTDSGTPPPATTDEGGEEEGGEGETEPPPATTDEEGEEEGGEGETEPPPATTDEGGG